MDGMIDIHCHILPGVDDGAPTVEVALQMLAAGIEQGVTAAILTPHIKSGDLEDRDELHRLTFIELEEALTAADLEISIYLGAEVAFRFGLADVARWPSVRLAGQSFVLVDLPPGPLSPGLEQGFFELRSSGVKVILAHPERHRDLAQSPEKIDRLRQQDLLLQVDAGSLMGRFGKRSKAAAEAWIGNGWVEFVGSDGHDLKKRPVALKDARNKVETLVGPNEARRLFVDNPGRLIDGEPIHRLEAEDVSMIQRRHAKATTGRRSFFGRLFGNSVTGR